MTSRVKVQHHMNTKFKPIYTREILISVRVCRETQSLRSLKRSLSISCATLSSTPSVVLTFYKVKNILAPKGHLIFRHKGGKSLYVQDSTQRGHIYCLNVYDMVTLFQGHLHLSKQSRPTEPLAAQTRGFGACQLRPEQHTHAPSLSQRQRPELAHTPHMPSACSCAVRLRSSSSVFRGVMTHASRGRETLHLR